MPGPHADGELELWLNRAISDTPDEWRRTNRFSSSRIAPATAVQGQNRKQATPNVSFCSAPIAVLRT